MKNKNLLLSFVLFFLITGFTPQISGMEENKRQLDADHLRKLLVNQEQYQLGMLNYRLENFTRAKSWFEKAAMENQKDPYLLAESEAFYMLSTMYALGQGVTKDEEIAKDYIKKFVNFSHLKGVSYFRMEKYEKAIVFFEQSALVKRPDPYMLAMPASFKRLGEMYNLGQGVAKDDVLAKSYSKRFLGNGYVCACEQTWWKKQYSAEYHYWEGMKLYNNKDYKDAEPFFKKAAQEGNPEAKFMLDNHFADRKYLGDFAECVFQEGMNFYTKGNFTAAKSKFEEAAQDGKPEANFWLAILYHFGFTGVEQNFEQAAIHYRAAATQDVTLAVDMLEGLKDTDSFKKYLKNYRPLSQGRK